MHDKSKIPFHETDWFQVTLLTAAIVSAVFQVTGPIPKEWLAIIPTGLSLALRRVSSFLATYGVWIALAIMCPLAYWKRALLLKAVCMVSRFFHGVYVRSLGFMLRPVVDHILRSTGSFGAVAAKRVREPSPLRILAARYGAGEKFNEVADLLNDRIEGGRLEILVSNATMGGDPNYAAKKWLTVDYWHSGTGLQKTVKEDETLKLP